MLASVWLTGHGAAVAVPPASASTCLGLPVTVTGAVGTEGDDVMLAPMDAWKQVEGLGGDDTICLVDGTDLDSRDPRFFADAGPGDDLVDYQATYPASVRLGSGSDRFLGNDSGADVYTGATAPIPGGVGYFEQADTDADVAQAGAGRDAVYSGDTGGDVPNPDRIATGDSNVDPDRVFYAGQMTSDGDLDDGASPDLLVLVGSWAPGELLIDDAGGRATLAGREVLRWTGVGEFVVDERPEAVRFVGGDGPDAITVGDPKLPTPGPPMSVQVLTGGGRDRVTLAGALVGRVALGRGRDALAIGGACTSARIHLARAASCTQGGEVTRTELGGVDTLTVAGPHVDVVGTPGPDDITVYGPSARLRGRAGRDVLTVSGRHGVVDGGVGRDRCHGGTQRRCERAR